MNLNLFANVAARAWRSALMPAEGKFGSHKIVTVAAYGIDVLL